jgi:polyisoprenoid-binding protein YceI
VETDVVDIPSYIAGTWTIDPVHSSVGFVIRHLMISKVRGRFNTFDGEIVTAADPLQSGVTATIQLASVDTGSAQRDAHIRSADFFDVDTHPTMTYRSTAIRRDGDGFIMGGELTLKGITRSISLELEAHGFGPDPFRADPFAGGRAGFTATAEINRMDFGVSYNGPIPGGGVGLGESVQIILEIQAILRPDVMTSTP